MADFTPTPPTLKQARFSLNKKNKIVLIIVLLVIAGAIVGGIAWRKHSKNVAEQKKLDEQVEINKKNAFALAGLPIDEDPLVSTVKDLEKVKDSEFFKNAQVGDTILFFKNARKAALYRDSERKFINVAQVIGEIPKEFLAGEGGKVEEIQPVNIAVYNGTTNSENILKAQDLLSKSFKSEIKIAHTDLARLQHKSTTVVDLSGANKGLAESIAALMKGRVDSFPPGEKTPPAMQEFPEILIFVGPDVPELQ